MAAGGAIDNCKTSIFRDKQNTSFGVTTFIQKGEGEGITGALDMVSGSSGDIGVPYRVLLSHFWRTIKLFLRLQVKLKIADNNDLKHQDGWHVSKDPFTQERFLASCFVTLRITRTSVFCMPHGNTLLQLVSTPYTSHGFPGDSRRKPTSFRNTTHRVKK